jgi:hypothetical protein
MNSHTRYVLKRERTELQEGGKSNVFFCPKCKDRNWLIECKCGCNNIRALRNNQGELCSFIQGHNLLVKNQLEDRNPYWKGDDIGYTGLHLWVRSRLQEPKLCHMCNKVPPLDLANITGIYNRELINWQYLCRSCHVHSDGRINNFNHRMNMDGRQCSKCKSFETHMIKNRDGKSYNRPLWRHWNGELLCFKCYRRQYYLKSRK